MNKHAIERALSLITNIASVLLSGIIAIIVLDFFGKLTQGFMTNMLVNVFVYVVLAALSSHLLVGRIPISIHSFGHYLITSLSFTGVFAGVLAGLLLIVKNYTTDSRYFFVSLIILTYIINALMTFIVHRLTIRYYQRSSTNQLVVVAATQTRANEAVEVIDADWDRRVVAVAYLDVDLSKTDLNDDAATVNGIPVVADKHSFVNWIRNNAIDEVYIIADNVPEETMMNAIIELQSMGIRVNMNLPSVERLDKSLDKSIIQRSYNPLLAPIKKTISYKGNIPLLSVMPRQMSFTERFFKRCFDIIGGILGSIFTILLIVIVGIPIAIESKGGIFFSQDRVGRNGRVFRMYKFRSMCCDAEQQKAELIDRNEVEGPMFKITDDPRITKVGKFIRKTSLDEFPQFFNVLKGDMSLVGTRPPTVDEYRQYSSYHKRRLCIKPGITGLWQVSGRSDISDFDEVVGLDCQYIDNWSYVLDIKILLRTVGEIFRHNGAK